MSEIHKVIIAIDSMKGCLSSREANEAAREAIRKRWPEADVVCLPVSDGGEGFLDAMEATGGWQRRTLTVHDPLMRPVEADMLVRGDRAVVELAQASGLSLLKPDERNPLTATTYGTGELLAEAICMGARDIVVGLGGSATSDCGQGLLRALEDRFGDIRRVPSTQITIATDVENPLLGPNGAVRVFAPQKGADDEMLSELEARSVEFASASAARCGIDRSREPGAGAAGGVGYALMQYLGAHRVSGISYMLGEAHFDAIVSEADLVVTGEGHADRQTLMGKLPMGILQCGRQYKVPVVLVAGRVSDEAALLEAGFARVLSITPDGMPLSEAIRPDVARRNLCAALLRAL